MSSKSFSLLRADLMACARAVHLLIVEESWVSLHEGGRVGRVGRVEREI